MPVVGMVRDRPLQKVAQKEDVAGDALDGRDEVVVQPHATAALHTEAGPEGGRGGGKGEKGKGEVKRGQLREHRVKAAPRAEAPLSARRTGETC